MSKKNINYFDFAMIKEELDEIGHDSLVKVILQFVEDYDWGAYIEKYDNDTRHVVAPPQALAHACELYYKKKMTNKEFIDLNSQMFSSNIAVIDILNRIDELRKLEEKSRVPNNFETVYKWIGEIFK